MKQNKQKINTKINHSCNRMIKIRMLGAQIRKMVQKILKTEIGWLNIDKYSNCTQIIYKMIKIIVIICIKEYRAARLNKINLKIKTKKNFRKKLILLHMLTLKISIESMIIYKMHKFSLWHQNLNLKILNKITEF